MPLAALGLRGDSRSLARIRIGVVWRGFRLAKLEFGLAEFGGFGGIGAGCPRGFLEEVAPAFVMIGGALRFLESLECGFSFLAAANDRRHSSGTVGSDVVQDDGVGGVGVVVCQKGSVCNGRAKESISKKRRGDVRGYRLSAEFVGLDSLNVFGLQALGALGDIELHRLAFLQALETARLDGREMHENVFA